MELNFTPAEVPTIARESKPNPFAGNLPLVDGQAVSVTVPHAADSAEVKRMKGQARRAAAAEGRTCRVKVVQNGKGAKVESVLTFWTTTQIIKTRKSVPTA